MEYQGERYGHKDVEFERFIQLPTLTTAPLEIAVAGKNVPTERLRAAGWRIRDAHQATSTFDSFVDYLRSSRAEFTVCKSAYVRMHTGWFSDRSAAYLASGRPVVMQDTGFSSRLPCGQGLFAARSVEEAAVAIDRVLVDYQLHSRAARELAVEHLDARRVLGRFLDELGL
jgi:hypothetical protein